MKIKMREKKKRKKNKKKKHQSTRDLKNGFFSLFFFEKAKQITMRKLNVYKFSGLLSDCSIRVDF